MDYFYSANIVQTDCGNMHKVALLVHSMYVVVGRIAPKRECAEVVPGHDSVTAAAGLG